MMDGMMTLRSLLEKTHDANLLREMISFAAERLMELEVSAFTMAAHGEKSLLRLAQRNGDRLCQRARAPGQPEGMGHRSVQPAAKPSPACQQHPRCSPPCSRVCSTALTALPFSPTHTRKGDLLYRYHVSQTVLKHGSGKCPVARVPAAEIEAAIIEQIRGMRLSNILSVKSNRRLEGYDPVSC